MKIIVSPDRALKFQVEKAVREGRLHVICHRTYGREYIETNFCGTCSFRRTCQRELEACQGCRKS